MHQIDFGFKRTCCHGLICGIVGGTVWGRDGWPKGQGSVAGVPLGERVTWESTLTIDNNMSMVGLPKGGISGWGSTGENL
jgi:hypothetical protein